MLKTIQSVYKKNRSTMLRAYPLYIDIVKKLRYA